MEHTKIKDKKLLKLLMEREREIKEKKIRFGDSPFLKIRPMNLGQFRCNGATKCK